MMQPLRETPASDSRSFATVAHELTGSVRKMMRGELRLATAELKDSATRVGKLSAQVGVFGGLAASSALPFIAFLVIGLGGILGGNYWLSSLIVAVVFAAVGGALALRAYKKMKLEEIGMPRTRAILEEESEMVGEKVEDIRDAATERRAA